MDSSIQNEVAEAAARLALAKQKMAEENQRALDKAALALAEHRAAQEKELFIQTASRQLVEAEWARKSEQEEQAESSGRKAKAGRGARPRIAFCEVAGSKKPHV